MWQRVNIELFIMLQEIYTNIHIEVMWDGEDFIEIRTPGSFKNQTCGFCGNYNDDPEDDLMLGPACPGLGNQVKIYIFFKALFTTSIGTQLLNTLWKKKKLLATSNFFSSHNVFYSIIKLYSHLSIFWTSYLYLLLNWKSPWHVI